MIEKEMSTLEKKKKMWEELEEVKFLASQKYPDGPHIYVTATGDQWLGVGNPGQSTDDFESFRYACLIDDGVGEKDAYMCLPNNSWVGVEMIMFTSHACDKLFSKDNGKKKGSEELLYYFLEQNNIFNLGYWQKRGKGNSMPGEKIFFTSIDTIGIGEIAKDGKLAVIKQIMSYQQAFGDQSLVSLWIIFASQIILLEDHGYRKKGGIWKLLNYMTRRALERCQFMEEMAQMNEDKLHFQKFANIQRPMMELLNNPFAIGTYNEMNKSMANDLQFLVWGANHLPRDLQKEFAAFVTSRPVKPKQTNSEELSRIKSILEEMEKLFRMAFEEVRTATMNHDIFNAV